MRSYAWARIGRPRVNLKGAHLLPHQIKTHHLIQHIGGVEKQLDRSKTHEATERSADGCRHRAVSYVVQNLIPNLPWEEHGKHGMRGVDVVHESTLAPCAAPYHGLPPPSPHYTITSHRPLILLSLNTQLSAQGEYIPLFILLQP